MLKVYKQQWIYQNKREISIKINLYPHCIECAFLRKPETIDKEELSNLLKRLNYIYKAMLSYCLKCRKNRESKNLRMAKTFQEKRVLLSICDVCDSKKWDLSKNKKQEDG